MQKAGEKIKSFPKKFRRFQRLFKGPRKGELLLPKKWDLKIELTRLAPPPARAYKLSPQERKELQGMLKEELENGNISKSESPTASPLFFVPKKK